MQLFLIEMAVESDYMEPGAFSLDGMIVYRGEYHDLDYVLLVHHDPGSDESMQAAGRAGNIGVSA